MSQDPWREGETPLNADAVGLHEGYLALRAAGFSERQACLILGAAIGEKAEALQERPHD